MPRPLFEIVRVERPEPEVALRVGGAFAGVPSPPCACCGEPLSFRFELIHVPAKLDLAPFARVGVFQCANAAFRCRPDLPDAGATRVVGVREPAQVRQGILGALRPASEDTAALSIDLEQASPEAIRAYEHAQDVAPQSKVGGVPIWLQGPDAPRCCGEPMELVAQLAGDAWSLDFGDGGAGYVFRCTREPERYAFMTQSY